LWHYQCGTTTPYIDEYIYTYAVPGATNYRIRIDDGVTNEIRTTTSTVFFFRQFAMAEYNTTYTCDVDAFVGGVWVGYGPTCEVTTPVIPLTKVANSQCGVTLATVNTTIFADAVWGVDLYEFSCFDGVTTQTFQTANRFFNLTQLASYSFSTTYQIRVRTRTNGVWTALGGTCNVTTPVQLAQINAAHCGTSLTDNSTDIFCNSIFNTTIYEFRLVNGGTTLTIQKPTRTFKFSQVAGVLPGTTYAVSARTFTSGSWSAFGPTCNIISSSALAALDAAYCGIVLTDNSTDIYATNIPSTTIYEFRLINGMTTLTIQKSSRTFKLSQVAGVLPGLVYSTSVRTFTNGVWPAFGGACNVTSASAASKIITSQCGSTLTNINTDLYADAIVGATQYRFRVANSGGTLTIDKASRTFKLTQLANVKYGEVNTIDVDVFVNGSWIGYGATCSVTTPALPTTKLQTSQCGITLGTTTTILYADNIAGATQYRFRVVNAGLSYSQVITKPSRLFRMSEMTGLAINTPYDVDVAVFINGAWQAYGSICSITTPAVLALPKLEEDEFADVTIGEINEESKQEFSLSEQVEENKFELKAYPNPFEGTFSLDFDRNGTKEIEIYNSNGQLVDERIVKSNQIEEYKFGETYSSCIYYVKIIQNTNVEMFKVIKK
jgi:hypothetical protein